MPVIRSRVHADILSETRELLAASEGEVDVLRQRLASYHDAMTALQEHQGRLETEAQQTRKVLAEKEEYWAVKQQEQEQQLRRMEANMSALEAMLQEAREVDLQRRDRSRSAVVCHDEADVVAALRRERDSLTAALAASRDERVRSGASHDTRSGEAVWRSFHSRSNGGATSTLERLPFQHRTSASTAEQFDDERVLQFCMEVARMLAELRQRLHGDAGLQRHGDHDASVIADTCKGRSREWQADEAMDALANKLNNLQLSMDEVVRVDSKLISFLTHVAKQQSAELQLHHRKWSEAQAAIHDAEVVLDDTHLQMKKRQQEMETLQATCDDLLHQKAELESQLAAATSSLRAAEAEVRHLNHVAESTQHRSDRQSAEFAARLAEAAQLQQRTTKYTRQLEETIQQKEVVMYEMAVAQAQQAKSAAVAAAQLQIDHFVQRFSVSAAELKRSIDSVGTAVPAGAVEQPERARSAEVTKISSPYSPRRRRQASLP